MESNDAYIKDSMGGAVPIDDTVKLFIICFMTAIAVAQPVTVSVLDYVIWP